MSGSQTPISQSSILKKTKLKEHMEDMARKHQQKSKDYFDSADKLAEAVAEVAGMTQEELVTFGGKARFRQSEVPLSGRFTGDTVGTKVRIDSYVSNHSGGKHERPVRECSASKIHDRLYDDHKMKDAKWLKLY